MIRSMRDEHHEKEQSGVVEVVGLFLLATLLVWPAPCGSASPSSTATSSATRSSWLVAVAGFLLLPWTALAYATMSTISSDRVSGWEWAFVAVAFLLDAWAWSAFFRR